MEKSVLTGSRQEKIPPGDAGKNPARKQNLGGIPGDN